MKSAIAILVTLGMLASPAHARDRDDYRHYQHEGHQHKKSNNDAIVYGIAGLIIGAAVASSLDDHPKQQQATPQYGYTYDSERAAYGRGRAERARQEREAREQRAYQCGYYGNC
jgi:hypothetical protein